ncbi:hypothetical protein OIV83_004658 [Microbotryomycetes sp. JL201]|nr:hypothetical protein OIV83_004658 [Microbotryomycetes sp. JL201]
MSHQAYHIAPDDDDDDLVATSNTNLLPVPPQSQQAPNSDTKGKGRAPNGVDTSSSHGSSGLSGRIGSGAPGSIGQRTTTTTIGGIRTETRSACDSSVDLQQSSHVYSGRYTGSNTLDEPVSETIMRDLRAIGVKIVQVLHPTAENAVLRDWDLWGPLIFCLTLAILLSMEADSEQSLPIFTGVFVIIWLGSSVVTLNAKLLGGKVSFFQSLCVLGYCIFPLDIAAVISLFIKLLWIRIPVCAAALAWSIWASVNFLGGTNLGDRSFLALYPLCLLYFLLAWMTMLS